MRHAGRRRRYDDDAPGAAGSIVDDLARDRACTLTAGALEAGPMPGGWGARWWRV
jgi:hypothetical protein